MPALIQICIVIVTIGLSAIAVMTYRMMARFNKTAEEISRLSLTVRESVVTFDLATQEARALVAALHECVPPVQRVMNRFEDIGNRTADLSSSLLDECELPVLAATAVARGVRVGAGHLLERLMDRFINRRAPTNGGHDHE
jgi:hypothetical protein